MSELMKDRLEAIGVDDDYIANEYKEFLENKKIPPNVRLNALNRVSALRGHDDKKIESLEGSTMIQLEDGDKKLLAVARKMLSADEIDKFLEQGEINGINKRESSKKEKTEINLDIESGSLYVDGLKYELEDDVLDVIDSLISELNMLEVTLLYQIGANLDARS